MEDLPGTEYVLGVDLGASSVGWALLGLSDGEPVGVVRAGAHGFTAGTEGDIESGKDVSRATARREARQPRRQHWRRAWRKLKLGRLLQRHGLLPLGDLQDPKGLHDLLAKLDQRLREERPSGGDRVAAHLFPYRLRAAALDGTLSPHQLGRAIYHLGQRRGFQANRKADARDEERSVVKGGIKTLDEQIKASGARTLGEYFAKQDPEAQRIRGRWTSRQMYRDEFEAIWSAQRSHHPQLTDTLKAQLVAVMFDQRPLKSQRHLIGRCPLMGARRRAPLALRIAQRFRMLQKVNDLEYDNAAGVGQRLNDDQRQTLINALDSQGDLTFAKVRRLLKLPKDTEFNLEKGGEKKLVGNRTDAKLADAFGDRWQTLNELQKEQVVDDLLTIVNPMTLRRRARRVWGLDGEAAQQLAETHLEGDYAAHCRQALQILVVSMTDGTSYATARRQAFPEQFEPGDPLEALPPVLEAVSDLRNPAVCRALTELRKVVNAIIRRYGKPVMIRVELARDLKRSRKQREQAHNTMKANRKRREAAVKRILAESNIGDPRSDDIEKVLLAEECQWRCPYTGKSICMGSLLGPNPQFDVEHIIPLSRSLDNRFTNKTLCYHEENRQRKRKLTPYEAYSHDAERYGDILQRVRKFDGPAARAKLRRFMMAELPADEFTARQLTDTRYASRLAADYLGLLYGGRVDAGGRQRIQVSPGGVTAHLRNELQLNGILNDGGVKTRDDHRHHAVDAVAIALGSPAVVKQLADAADRADGTGRRFVGFKDPWPRFNEEVRRAIEAINVSYRPEGKIAGPLHADSLYSKAQTGPDGRPVRHIRKHLTKLTPTEINSSQIVDPVVRKLVQEAYTKLGGGNPAKAFADPTNHPRLPMRNGRSVPIHKVRIRARAKVQALGKGPRQRYVAAKAGANHHVVIVATLDAQGNPTTWKDHRVTRLEVHRRKSTGQPIIQRRWPSGQAFQFSLVPNEHVVMEDDDGVERLFRLLSISKGDMEFRLHCDARIADQIRKARARIRAGGARLFQRKARKVRVTYLGEIRHVQQRPPD